MQIVTYVTSQNLLMEHPPPPPPPPVPLADKVVCYVCCYLHYGLKISMLLKYNLLHNIPAEYILMA